jgi:hypothetical protein
MAKKLHIIKSKIYYFPIPGTIYLVAGRCMMACRKKIVKNSGTENPVNAVLTKEVSSSLYPFPTLSGVCSTCFSSSCDEDSAIIFTNGHLSDVNFLETGVGANYCKCSRNQLLNVPSQARRSSR